MGVTARAFAGLLFLVGVLALALFTLAGGLDYWQAWVFLAVFGTLVTLITLDLARRDPALLERRTKAGPVAEGTRVQQLIQSLASLAFLAIFGVSALDHRHEWSRVPSTLSAGGDGLVVLGLFVVFRVFRANTFTSATIEVASDQRVISTGPYALVRHPMYAGALLFLLGVPLALGSFWALAGVFALAAVIVWRLLDEERYLAEHLRGYAEYRARVKFRLVPYVW
jgi:protein-S-isoprenylcysteine O-methyltransferase Ste14